MSNFVHLHCHTQFSLLDGAADISGMFKKAAKDGMKGVAITDHGNMFGVFNFVAEAAKHKTADGTPLKPIIGCEFYLVENRQKLSFTKEDRDVRRHQLFLAKNATGYKNLVKLCSLGYTEGLYGKYPRIDKELVLQYHEGLIATTCCIGAEVPQTILRKGEEEAEKVFKWWLGIFGEDYYIELQDHGMPDQLKVNKVLLKFAEKYNVKTIATNDSHYIDQTDANAHDILLCINTGEKQATPKVKEFSDDDAFVKGSRFAFYNDQFYFKNTAEMSSLFPEHPEAIENTMEILGKVETLSLKKDILLPHYTIPVEFASQDDYLTHLTFQGAKNRYDPFTPEIEARINFELHTIKTMGFAGYFLIVQDFINKGKDIGVFVGPGRGSAAGSVVAYCIGITNIDPIKYNLLFERFLNPDRKSMPDIDTDFDDEGRQKVIDYVVEKYGQKQVAQIITYGTMAAKMSIKDVARVMDLPLPESNALAALVPDKPGTNLNRVIFAPIEGEKSLKEKEGFIADDINNIKQLREIYEGNDLRAKVLKEAVKLEGSVRNTGIHAAGIIIAPTDLTEILPVAASKDTKLYITQFEGSIIEDAGVIKMDFLGLKTLSILKEAVRLIAQNHGVNIDLDTLPLDDKKTYELYQRGATNGTFQFESVGMQKHLRDLKPDKFEDLIAMNALYRPGPIEYIPNFIRRKHGVEKIEYDLPELEEYLAETYGITVYQEQVMLLSQKLADFSKGDADVLRKAMGKKQIAVLDKMKSQFMEGATKKGLNPQKLEKIWTDWEAFAQYAFNKSHSTCYAFVAYQTAYLKAHYPSEYMAAVLSNNQGNIDKITFFMEESKAMGIPVLGPDVNESDNSFSVNKKGEIRFALSAIKGVGEAAVDSLLQERKENGTFTSFFDLAKRVNLRTVNKKSLENLALAGAFDEIAPFSRRTFIEPDSKDGTTLIEKAIRYGNAVQLSKVQNQTSLFGGSSESNYDEPQVASLEEWSHLEKLNKEKEVVGIFITGHPLDDYRLEIKTFTNADLNILSRQIDFVGNKLTDSDKPSDENEEEQQVFKIDFNKKNILEKEFKIAGIITQTNTRISKNGNQFVSFTLQDFSGFYAITLFGKDYIKYKNYAETAGAILYLKGRVANRFNQENSFEFKVSDMELLSEIRQKLTKRVSLQLVVQSLTEAKIAAIKELAKTNKGKVPMWVNLYDSKNNLSLNMNAQQYFVNPTNDFIKAANELGIEVSLT